MTADTDVRTWQQLTAAFDTPAYLRRARRVETEWQLLLATCARERESLLEMPRVRLKLLLTGAALGTPPLEEIVTPIDAARLRAQAEAWELKWPGPSQRFRHAAEAKAAFEKLCTSWERFNRRWQAWVADLDLTRINQLRDGYNRYYLIEKECATGSWHTAQSGYAPLAPVTQADLLAAYPLLLIPGGTTPA